MTSKILKKDFSRPQVIYSGDHKLKSIGHQLEATQLTNRTIGPIASPVKGITDILGLLDTTGGRVFLTEGEWIFNQDLSTDRDSVHIVSTSPGKTVFKRPLTKASATVVMEFTGDDIVLDGIRFIDEGNTTATYMISLAGQRCTIKNCVFEDVYGGIKITGNWCSVRDCTFITTAPARPEEDPPIPVGYAVEFSGTASNGIVIGNIIQDNGGSVYLGDSVSEVAVLSNVFQNASGGDVKISYFENKEIVTGSALNVVHADQVEERS